MTATFVYSGFWRRFFAVCLDFAILILPMLALSWVLPYAGSIVLALFYYPVFESSSIQATPGKYWMGLKVLNENGQTLSFPRALGRFFLKYVSSVFLMIGYIMQVFTAKRQTLHDMITNSIVVDHVYTSNPDWFQVWLHQMKFVLRVENHSATSQPTGYQGSEASSTVQDADFTTVDNGNSQNQDSSTATASNAVGAIEKLYELYKGGALTEDEFQAKKAELLKQI